MATLIECRRRALDLTGQIRKLHEHYSYTGSFGDVHRCLYDSPTGTIEVAVKALRFSLVSRRSDSVHEASEKSLRRELGIWKRLHHPNIVPFLGTASGFGPHAALVSMWMPHGTLHSFLADRDDQLSLIDRFHLLRDIASGMKYLHDLSVIHGDLTSRNVLIDEQHRARLMDFGYSSVVGEDALAYLQWTTRRPGAIRWAAPEQVQSTLQSQKSDIYSFGCLMLQILSGKEPWSEIENIIHIVILLANGDNPSRPSARAIADEHWAFIQKCWLPVEDRLSAKEVVETNNTILVSLELPSICRKRKQCVLTDNNVEQENLPHVLLDTSRNVRACSTSPLSRTGCTIVDGTRASKRVRLEDAPFQDKATFRANLGEYIFSNRRRLDQTPASSYRIGARRPRVTHGADVNTTSYIFRIMGQESGSLGSIPAHNRQITSPWSSDLPISPNNREPCPSSDTALECKGANPGSYERSLMTKSEPSYDASPKQDIREVYSCVNYSVIPSAISSRGSPKSGSYECSRSAYNFFGNCDHHSPSSPGAHQQLSLKYYMDNVLCKHFPHIALIPTITNLIRGSDTARKASCMLAAIVGQQTCIDGLEPVEPEDSHQRLQTLYHASLLTEGDAFAALCMVSCAILSGEKSQWQTFLDAACEFCLSFLQNSEQGSIRESFRQCPESLRFIVKTTIWFDILGSVTLVRAPKMLDIIRELMVPHGSSSSDESATWLAKYSMATVMGCENHVVLCLAEIASLAHWKEIHDAAGNLDVVELVERGQKIEQALNGPSTALSELDPTKPQSCLTTEILRASAHLYLHSVISGDRPRCARIAKAVDETVNRVKAAETIQVDIFTLFMSACLADNLDHRNYLLERLEKQLAGSAVTSLIRKSWQQTTEGSVDWRRIMRDADIPLI